MTTARPSDEYTAPVEDYLKVIYEIERYGSGGGAVGAGGGGASGAGGGAGTKTAAGMSTGEGVGVGVGVAATNEIAQRLAIAPASVSGMVRRLADQGLLEHERYRGVRLTDAGRRVALRTIRRHRVIEAYLTRALGYPWDLVHEEAERLEHAASDQLIDRMAAAIGEPTTDPHGAPIPTREGTIEERSLITIADLEPGERGRIVRVSDDDAARLRYLGELGLTPGVEVRLASRAPFGGPLALLVGGRDAERLIGPALSTSVMVERLE